MPAPKSPVLIYTKILSCGDRKGKCSGDCGGGDSRSQGGAKKKKLSILSVSYNYFLDLF